MLSLSKYEAFGRCRRSCAPWYKIGQMASMPIPASIGTPMNGTGDADTSPSAANLRIPHKAENRYVSPKAWRKRCFKTTASRSGKTRGGSSAATRTSAKSSPSQRWRRSARSATAASSLTASA